MYCTYLNGALELDEGMLLRGAARQEAVGSGRKDAKVIVPSLDAGRGSGPQGERRGGRQGDGPEGENVDFAAALSFAASAAFSPGA
jgi:hypothetical protein